MNMMSKNNHGVVGPIQSGCETERGDAASQTYTIGDLAREFGVTLRALRFYEDRGLLTPQREGTARIYDARDRARLSVILKGKHLGFTLTEIRAMLAVDERSAAPAADLNISLAQIEDQLAHLEGQKEDIEQAIEELKAHRDALMRASKA